MLKRATVTEGTRLSLKDVSTLSWVTQTTVLCITLFEFTFFVFMLEVAELSITTVSKLIPLADVRTHFQFLYLKLYNFFGYSIS